MENENSLSRLNDKPLNFEPSLKESLLIAAVRDNDLNMLKSCLASKIDDPHLQSYTCGTPLVAAAFFDNLDAFKILLDSESELFDASCHPGLLLTAIRADNPDMVRLLLEKGVPLNETGENNYKNPPYWFDSIDETPFDPYGPPVFELPIIVAIQDETLNALKVLIEYNPDLVKKGTLGYNVDFLLSSKNTSTTVKTLFANKASQEVSKEDTSSVASDKFFHKKAFQKS